MTQATLTQPDRSRSGSGVQYVDSPDFRERDAADRLLAPLPQAATPTSRHKPPAGTPPYLAALYEYQLLSREQEQHLFRKMNYLKFRASEIERHLSTDVSRTAQLDQMQAFLADALLVRNQIVECNLRLVVSIAKKLVDPANRLEDLISEGNGPLIRAVEIFDFERGTRFSTYATWAIRNHLYRISTKNRQRQRRSHAATDALGGMNDELASLPSENADRLDLQQFVLTSLGRLDKRDRSILAMRFGLAGANRPLLFREIADRLNVSTERARQLLSRAVERLRELVDSESNPTA